jgi:hypothetical protein
MTDQIDFFDERNVGPEARRLAFCFNVSARMVSQDRNPLSHAEALFRTTTGLETVPAFNRDEENYLKLTLIETAAIRDRGDAFSLDELREAANLLYLDAREMSLIRSAEKPADLGKADLGKPGL